ncbi:MAG: DUF2312 domain-containing protein [Holosporaceae bacterium]|jgi:uncharacterized protein (UPF0335 family)|nr:DUF2312 domain-containing protein [Holosporaceae bacterium]
MHSAEASSLKRYIEEIENLETEKSEIQEQITDIYAKAKSEGFDPKIMKKVIKIKKMKIEDRENEDLLLDTYMLALGLIPGDDAAMER